MAESRIYLMRCPTDGRRGLVYLDISYLSDAANQYIVENEGGPIPSAYLPSELKLVTGHEKQLTDVISVMNQWVVSARALSALSQLIQRDSEVSPVQLISRKGKRISQEFYFVNILSKNDCLVLDRGSLRPFMRSDGKQVVNFDTVEPKLYCRSLDINRNLNIWHEQFGGEPGYRDHTFVSSKFQHEIMVNKMTGVEFFAVRQVKLGGDKK